MERRQAVPDGQGFFPANPVAMRMNAAPRTAAYHLGVAALMVLIAWTAWGRSVVGVHPLLITVTTAAFAMDLVDLARRVNDGSLFRPSAWGRRMLSAFVLLVYTASFAAPSEIVASPAWVFLVMAGSIAGLIGTHLGPAFGGLALLAGPGFHVLAAPVVSAGSVTLATAAALLAWVAALAGRRLSHFAIELERQASVREQLQEEAREDAQRLASAMSIHDGLSGMYFGVRTRLEVARTVDEVRAPGQGFVRRAREVVRPSPVPASIVTTLRALAELEHVSLRLEGSPEVADPLEAADLAFTANELVTNALRHRRVSSLVVTFLSGRERGVTVHAEGPLVKPERATGGLVSGGRGTRHLELRASAWGGTSTRTDMPTSSFAVVKWPRRRSARGPLWLALLLPLTALPVLGVLASHHERSELLAYLGAVSVLTTLGLGYDARALRRTAGLLLPRGQAPAPVSTSLAHAFLGTVERAEQALSSDDLLLVRAQMHDVGQTLARLIERLEADAGSTNAGRSA